MFDILKYFWHPCMYYITCLSRNKYWIFGSSEIIANNDFFSPSKSALTRHDSVYCSGRAVQKVSKLIVVAEIVGKTVVRGIGEFVSHKNSLQTRNSVLRLKGYCVLSKTIVLLMWYRSCGMENDTLPVIYCQPFKERLIQSRGEIERRTPSVRERA